MHLREKIRLVGLIGSDKRKKTFHDTFYSKPKKYQAIVRTAVEEHWFNNCRALWAE